MLLLHVVEHLHAADWCRDFSVDMNCFACPVGFLLRVPAELDESQASPSGNSLRPAVDMPLSCMYAEHAPVDALERDRLELVAERDVIAGGEDVVDSRRRRASGPAGCARVAAWPRAR